MIDLLFAEDGYSQLALALLSGEEERCAILVCRHVPLDGAERFLVREVIHPAPEEYLERNRWAASLTPNLVARLGQMARTDGVSLIFAHSHPFDPEQPEFSPRDDGGEALLAAFLERRAAGTKHGALVVSPGGARFRVLGTRTYGRVVQVGATRIVPTAHDPADLDERHDRQVRAFGNEGQRTLASLHVGVVGGGGTGSVVVQELAHLGVGRITIVDPDVVEATNLNRLVGASPGDIGSPKANVLAAEARRVAPSAMVEARVASVLLAVEAQRLASVDFLFCCTDSHGSRAILNQLAYQYLVPMIDMGVAIIAEDERVRRVVGRVQMLAPGLGCLICGGVLDPEQVRRDFLTEFERQQDPYIVGGNVPQPSVISLNATVASIAVTMFLSAVVGVPSKSRCSLYDAIAGTVRVGIAAREPACIVCSRAGSLARGNEWPLPGRRT